MFLKGSRESDLRVYGMIAQFGAVGRVRLGELVKGTTPPDIQKKKKTYHSGQINYEITFPGKKYKMVLDLSKNLKHLDQ